MSIEELKRRKKELGYTNRTLAELSGVPFGTVQKLMSGATKTPRYETLQALRKVLLPENYQAQHMYIGGENGHIYPNGNDVLRDGLYVRETEAWYQYGSVPEKKHQGQYTVDDVMALPDDVRMELIDGVLYDMASPTALHQAIAGYIHHCMLDHVRRNKGGCFPFISPLSVQLDRDEKTMVQPDVLVICRKDAEDLFRENNILFGAPDFILEVITPSSVRKDAVIKMRKYKEAGVREFWLIDPKEKVLFVYDLENEQGNVVYLYSFNEKVPVRIWNGALEIDLVDMYQSIEWLYERRM